MTEKPLVLGRRLLKISAVVALVLGLVAVCANLPLAEIPVALAIFMLLVGSYSDLKSYDVPTWLPVAFIGIGVAFYFVVGTGVFGLSAPPELSADLGRWVDLLYLAGFLGAVAGFTFASYCANFWGQKDVLAFAALAALLPLHAVGNLPGKPYLFVPSLLLNSLIVGFGPALLIYVAYRSIRNPSLIPRAGARLGRTRALAFEPREVATLLGIVGSWFVLGWVSRQIPLFYLHAEWLWIGVTLWILALGLLGSRTSRRFRTLNWLMILLVAQTTFPAAGVYTGFALFVASLALVIDLLAGLRNAVDRLFPSLEIKREGVPYFPGLLFALLFTLLVGDFMFGELWAMFMGVLPT